MHVLTMLLWLVGIASACCGGCWPKIVVEKGLAVDPVHDSPPYSPPSPDQPRKRPSGSRWCVSCCAGDVRDAGGASGRGCGRCEAAG